MPQSLFPAVSQRSQVSTPRESWISSRLIDAARILLLCGIYAAVWNVGGYYPEARLIVLAFITAATALTLPSFCAVDVPIKPMMPLLLVGSAVIFYGLLQIAPFSYAGLLDWSGVRDLQHQYGAEAANEAITVPLTQSLVPWKSQAWLAMFAIGVGGYFLGGMLFNDSSSRALLLSALVICGVGQVLWAIVQVSGHPDEIFFGIKNPATGSSPFGTFINRNHAADFIAVALGCAAGLWRFHALAGERNWKSGYGVSGQLQAILSNPLTLAIWIGLVCLIVGVALSLSRGAWGATLIAAVFVALMWKRKKEKRRIGLAAGVLVSLVVACFSLQFLGLGDRVSDRMEAMEMERVFSDARFDHWSDVVPALQHFLPFGSGLGTYGDAYLAFAPEPSRLRFTHAHNQYLETVMEMGVFGLVIVAAGLFISIRIGLRLCSSDRSRSKQALGIAALFAVTVHALHAITEFGLMMPGNMLTLSVLLGAATSANLKSAAPDIRVKRKLVRQAGENTPSQRATPTPDQRTTSALDVTFVSAMIMLTMCVAVWQQGRHVRAAKLVKQTEFEPSTPSPTVKSSSERIAAISRELENWPLYEPLLRQKIKLHLHQMRRLVYDEHRKQQSESESFDPVIAWGTTSMELVVVRLFDDSPDSVSPAIKASVRQTLGKDKNLTEAWANLQASVWLNPVQPRTHMLKALIAASTGRPWQAPFTKSMKLSGANAGHTFSNGLLAWAANDHVSMVQQWKQNLSTDNQSIAQIYKLAAIRLSDQEIVEELMPNRWQTPYYLATQIKRDGGPKGLQASLLSKSANIAQQTLDNEVDRHQALGTIASANGEYSVASEHYEQAIQSEPRNARLRYLSAVALYRKGDAEQAVRQARIATLLDPEKAGYRNLLLNATKLHRNQHSKPSTENEIE